MPSGTGDIRYQTTKRNTRESRSGTPCSRTSSAARCTWHPSGTTPRRSIGSCLRWRLNRGERGANRRRKQNASTSPQHALITLLVKDAPPCHPSTTRHFVAQRKKPTSTRNREMTATEQLASVRTLGVPEPTPSPPQLPRVTPPTPHKVDYGRCVDLPENGNRLPRGAFCASSAG